MNQKLQAVKRTAGVLAIATLAPTVISAVLMLDSAAVGWTMIAAIFGFFVYLVYSISLNQIEIEQAQKIKDASNPAK